VSYREKLSGPILDRFQVVAFTSLGQQKPFSLSSIYGQVEAARAFAAVQGRKQSHWESIDTILETVPSFWRQRWAEMVVSERRKNAVLRVARSLADLAQKEKIESQFWAKANEFALAPFDRLKRWDLSY
jgi:predicted ATPase with chaperone activity